MENYYYKIRISRDTMVFLLGMLGTRSLTFALAKIGKVNEDGYGIGDSLYIIESQGDYWVNMYDGWPNNHAGTDILERWINKFIRYNLQYKLYVNGSPINQMEEI